MSTELTSRNHVGAGLAASLIADHLGVSLDDLKRKREEQIAAEEARKQEARRAKVANFISMGLIRAWRSDPTTGALTEIRDIKGLACPKCGEVPPKLGAIARALADALNQMHHPQLWFDRGSLSPAVAIKRVPGFRSTIPCKCGTRTVYAAVYLPETEV